MAKNNKSCSDITIDFFKINDFQAQFNMTEDSKGDRFLFCRFEPLKNSDFLTYVESQNGLKKALLYNPIFVYLQGQFFIYNRDELYKVEVDFSYKFIMSSGEYDFR